jgi:S1-C subfamily serine protease
MSNTLVTLSNEMGQLVQQAGPGIVRVEGRRRMPASGIVWSDDGLIVTAHHVVQRDQKITIGLADGETTRAELVGRDPTTDLALLRAEGGLTAAPRAAITADTLAVGNLVLALARPGLSVQATLGVVSALAENWRAPTGARFDYYLQTDVLMYPGFSGGPLVNAAGQVIGLNSSAMLRGASMAVPVNTIERVVSSLLAHGHIKRGYLGISTQPVRLPAALAEQLGQETGLLLVSVEPDSPAESGGLLLGDTIVSVAGETVRQHDDLMAQLSGDRIGSEIAISIIRGGQLAEVSAMVGER